MQGTLYYNGERVCGLEIVTIDIVDGDYNLYKPIFKPRHELAGVLNLYGDVRERFHIWYLFQLANGKPEDFFRFEYWRAQ